MLFPLIKISFFTKFSLKSDSEFTFPTQFQMKLGKNLTTFENIKILVFQPFFAYCRMTTVTWIYFELIRNFRII